MHRSALAGNHVLHPQRHRMVMANYYLLKQALLALPSAAGELLCGVDELLEL